MEAVGPTPFKMFGLQRTGTNLMIALLRENFHVHSLEAGTEWKHGPLMEPDRQWNNLPASFVLCGKNPYAWLVSCFRYFTRAIGADSTIPPQFTRAMSTSFEKFVLTPSYQFASPVHRWNEMNRSWLATLPDDRTAVVRHEDLLADQIKVLQLVQAKLGLRSKGPLTTINQRVDVGVAKTGPMNIEYYAGRKYLEQYTLPLLAKVNSVLDTGLMNRFSYPLEE